MLKSTIESLIFISNRPLTKKEISVITEAKIEEVGQALEELVKEYNEKNGGIKIIQDGKEFQMVTNPDNTTIIQKFLKEEVTRELTPASLETLAIVAYRGPISRGELEQIRGVNCAIILRNLLIRGLVIESDADKDLSSKDPLKCSYNISLDFIRHLGITDIKDLPNYEKLNSQIPLQTLAGEEQLNKNPEPLQEPSEEVL